MSRIDDCFDRLRGARAAFIAYATAFYPDREASLQVMRAMLEEADMLEIGVPFSDPSMDGPVIQEASRCALEAGATLEGTLSLVRELRETTEKPLLAMSYLNPLLAMGLARFAHRAAAVGLDGVLIPDLPLEEAADWLELANEAGIAPVLFVSLTTGRQRMRRIGEASRGFVYAVATLGITGIRKELDERLDGMLAELKSQIRVPVAAGFGISDAAQCAAIGREADGVIVGSALMGAVAQADAAGADPAGAVRAIMAPMVAGLHR
ncbi:MAG: tryptophan synthase subunit alpha [Candidatus Geothermincolia bacterium]